MRDVIHPGSSQNKTKESYQLTPKKVVRFWLLGSVELRQEKTGITSSSANESCVRVRNLTFLESQVEIFRRTRNRIALKWNVHKSADGFPGIFFPRTQTPTTRA